MAEVVFQIKDMHCEKCVEKIRKALENVAGLEEMKFDLDNKNIIIQGEVDPLVLDQIFLETGYSSIIINPES
tara:strand:- start:3 stop:218 length:216 start_codon:yes stop_codon:yes gene_type:complete